jgi:hypothetical protein
MGMRKPMESIQMVNKEDYMQDISDLNGEMKFNVGNIHIRDNYF